MPAQGDFIEWLVKVGILAVERVGQRYRAPFDVIEDARDILTDQLAHRFPSLDEWSTVRFPDSYLQQAARRALWRAFARARRRRSIQLTAPPPTELREPQCSREEVFEKIHRALRSLTPGELKAVRFAHQGHSMAVIARFLDTTVETVYTLLCTARKKIRKIWHDSA